MAAQPALGLVLLLGLVPPESGREASEAIVVHAGSVATRQVVAVGRDLEVAGEARSDIAVIGGSAQISGRVKGDVIVLGGHVRLAESARVGGDVYVLGGEIDARAGATIEGRSMAYPSAPSTWLVLLEGPALGQPATSPLVIAAKIALLAAWTVAAVLLLATNRRQVLVTAARAREEPFRSFFTGVVGVFALVLTVVFFSALAAAIVGVPLLVLAALFALLLKIFGTVAVFCAVGTTVLGWLGRRRELPLTAAVVGLVTLGLLKLVPYVGIWIWTLVTFTGVGAALSTKLGRDEPWFEGVLEAS